MYERNDNNANNHNNRHNGDMESQRAGNRVVMDTNNSPTHMGNDAKYQTPRQTRGKDKYNKNDKKKDEKSKSEKNGKKGEKNKIVIPPMSDDLIGKIVAEAGGNSQEPQKPQEPEKLNWADE